MSGLDGMEEEQLAWDLFRAAILDAERDPSPKNIAARDRAKARMLEAMGAKPRRPSRAAAA